MVPREATVLMAARAERGVPVAEARTTVGGRRCSWPRPGSTNRVKTIYQVKRGDTLASIARLFQTTVASIRTWNPRISGRPPDDRPAADRLSPGELAYTGGDEPPGSSPAHPSPRWHSRDGARRLEPSEREQFSGFPRNHRHRHGCIDGDALRHARVFATAASGSVPATLTDDRGRYTLAGLSTGRHILTVVKPGYVRRTMPVDVPVRQPDGVDVQLVRGAVISGALIDELGEPVTSTSATIRAVSDIGDITHARIVAVGQTDDLGQFRVSGLAAGSYILEATPGLMRTMSRGRLVHAGLHGRAANA